MSEEKAVFGRCENQSNLKSAGCVCARNPFAAGYTFEFHKYISTINFRWHIPIAKQKKKQLQTIFQWMEYRDFRLFSMYR